MCQIRGEMNKEDKRKYERQIDDLADDLIIKAQRAAFDYTEGVFRDILTALHGKIEQYFKEHQR